MNGSALIIGSIVNKSIYLTFNGKVFEHQCDDIFRLCHGIIDICTDSLGATEVYFIIGGKQSYQHQILELFKHLKSYVGGELIFQGTDYLQKIDNYDNLIVKCTL